MPSSISKSKFEASRSASASPSPGFGLSLQTTVVTEICSELGYGVVDGVGGHTKCLRDRICPELQDRDIPSGLEKVVEKGVPLQEYSGVGGRKLRPLTHPMSQTCKRPHILWPDFLAMIDDCPFCGFGQTYFFHWAFPIVPLPK